MRLSRKGFVNWLAFLGSMVVFVILFLATIFIIPLIKSDEQSVAVQASEAWAGHDLLADSLYQPYVQGTYYYQRFAIDAPLSEQAFFYKDYERLLVVPMSRSCMDLKYDGKAIFTFGLGTSYQTYGVPVVMKITMCEKTKSALTYQMHARLAGKSYVFDYAQVLP